MAQDRVAQDTLTQAGFTGLGITPNAHLLGWGRTEFAYDSQLPGMRNPEGHNYVLGFGLLPNLEIAGRLAANTLHTSCYTGNCGARDLSASAKAGIGLDAQGRFRIAAGMTDVGGAVTYFRTYYGVGTYSEGPWEASVGLARRSGAGINRSQSPLHGPFAAAAWQPLPWVRGHVEYTDGNAWAGVRVFAPAAWLPEGWQLSAGVHQRLNQNAFTERQWWSASVSIPLYKVPDLPKRRAVADAPLPVLAQGQERLPAYEARVPGVAGLAAVDSGLRRNDGSLVDSGLRRNDELAVAAAQAGPHATQQPTDTTLQTLATTLQAKGLQDIWIGRMADQSIAIRADNATYTWNSVDALGAALAAVAKDLGDHQTAYRLILTEHQQPLVAITGQTNCLREWIRSDTPQCPGGELTTPGTGPLDTLHGGAAWVVQGQQPASQSMRVGISPVLRTNVGSEVGAADYSLGANIGIEWSPWAGGSLELRQNVPVSESRNFEEGALFSDRRVRTLTERIAFTQTQRLPLDRWLAPGNDTAARRWGLGAVTGQATIGRIGGWWDGALASVRWEPGDGTHRVAASAGRFAHADFGDFSKPGPRNATPILGSYRYHVAPTRSYLEATAGRFMFDDLGVQLGLRQWFSDVSVHVYYKGTRFDGQPMRHFGGIEISLPLGPRQDYAPTKALRIGGTQRFTTGLETTLREPAGGNPLRFGHGMQPPAPSLDATFNSDRAGLRYFEDNLRRIRDAARQQQGA